MAKRRAAPKRKTRTKSKPLPGWIWLATGLIIGLSATFLPKFNETYLNNNKDDQAQSKPTEVELEPEREFDFYTILPELEVVVDDKPLPANNVKQQEAASYVLQIGSFKSDSEADSLKARLALLGVETNIEVVTVNQVNWHRVRIGPSKDVGHLQSVQARLQSEKLDAILLKVRG